MQNWLNKNAKMVIVYCFVYRKAKGAPNFNIADQVMRTFQGMENKDK